MADDRVAAAVAELYGADPDAFTERRKALAAAAKDAGERGAATAIAALRKPTRAAWLVNQLARADPGAPARLADLAAELRAAEQAKDGPRLRELSADRGRLLDALTAQALAAAGTPEPPASLRAEVTATLTAALADPETAAGFAAGTLTKAAQWSGFGYAEFPAADGGSPPDRAPAAGPAPRPERSGGRSEPDSPAGPPLPIRLPEQGDRARQTGRSKRAEPGARVEPIDRAAQRAAQQREREQQRQAAQEQQAAAEDQRRAREAAERAARAREKFDDLERTVVQASAAAAEAGAVEDGLEAEVRQLEERLTQARDELAAARMRARRAEAAERRARQALDRLPRP